MSDTDVLICKAFQRLIQPSSSSADEDLDLETQVSIAQFLTELPLEDRLNVSKMANKIGEFCYKPGNQKLKKWLLATYNTLGSDDIKALVKKTGDPGEAADAMVATPRMLSNEGRDVCQALQNWSTEVLENKSQGSQNAPKSN